MNEELTREVLEAIVNCNGDGDCRLGSAKNFCNNKILATALLEERAKPKVWDGAPEWVNAARVRFFVNDRNDGHSEVFSETYRRELPKTRARIIAEEVTALINRAIYGTSVKEIEAVLKRYAGELTNTKETN
jgi:hypothetical protein